MQQAVAAGTSESDNLALFPPHLQT